MDKFSIYSHRLVPNGSFGMDELCNFEPNRMYASVDMHQGSAILSTHAESACHIGSKISEVGSDDHISDALDDDTIMEDSVNEDNKSIVQTKTSAENYKNRMVEFENVDFERMAPNASPLCSNKNRLSISSSSSSKRMKLQTSSQQSSTSSHTTRHGGSALNEDDTDDLDDEITSHCVTLVDGIQSVTFRPENIILCINAGGASVSDTSFGAEFSEDCHFLGGDVLRTGETIANTKDPLIYQTARYGNFSYFVKDMPPGDYLVDLHFAEIIFTNGPPGLRVFDVLVQDHKVIAALDVFSLVGSNTPLIVTNIGATVKKEGLSISFRGIAGSPSLSGICIRKPESQVAIQYVGQLHKNITLDAQELPKDLKESQQNVPKIEVQVMESLQSQVQEHQSAKHKSKTRKRVREYELKIEELKNEVHQAWLSVQDANRQNEKLQSELDCRSLHVDSLAQAVERQLYDLNDVKDQAEREKKEWRTKMLQIFTKYQFLKADYSNLAEEAHEWVSSFPAIQSMTEKVQALVDELEELKKKFVKQGQDLRLYYNQVLELKGNIRVFCRCRPLSAAEINMGASSVVEFDSTRDNELIVRSNGAKKTFKFDRVFSPSNGQLDVFSDTAPVVVSVLDGYNVCIFAYGQTGTGKTFTMEGVANDRGVNYRTLEELFRLTAKRKGQYEYTISVSVLEVYNEQIRDLLAQPLPLGQFARKLEIKQVAEGVHHVPGLTEATVHCMEEVWDVLQTGSSARAMGSTNANEHSSRSHCMLCVMVKGENLLTGECTRSKLWLVDLAGSERVAKTDVQGERLKEAQNINKSLSALGDVIHSLATKSSHVPYRNSKLTHLLQDSLGGESKTLMFVQISPSELDAGETLCSLNFASRVRGVELGPARKQLDSTDTAKYKQMTDRLKQDVRVKDETLKKQEDSMKRLEDTLKAKEQALRVLSDKVKENEKARSTAECKLKEQHLLIEKLQEEMKKKESSNSLQMKENEKVRSTTECMLKEQHLVIEKLREELKIKEASSSVIAEQKLKEKHSQIEKLQEELKARNLFLPMTEQSSIEPVQVMESSVGPSDELNKDRNIVEMPPDSDMEVCKMITTEVSDAHTTKRATTTGASPVKTKLMSSKCNGSSPATAKKATGKSGRSSLAGAYRKRASMASACAPPLRLATQTVTTDTMDCTRTSSDSLEDSYPDENMLPHLQQGLAATVVSSPRSAGWKKGTAIAPSTVLRRSIPRKIHFKSPHLQPSYLKGTLQATPACADREGCQVAAAERILTAQNRRDQNAEREGRLAGASKTRRVTIATTRGRPSAVLPQQQVLQPPWNGTTTVLTAGGAQRVPVSNISKPPNLYNRERAWNR